MQRATKIGGTLVEPRWRFVALIGLLPLLALAQPAPPAQPFQRLDGCVLTPDEWTDGDSFRVRLPDGRLATFRLYFVDTTESRSRGVRSDAHAAYFGLTRTEAIELGQKAKAFTAGVLQKPFTIQTRWRTVFGPTRYYAVVLTADGNDLAELLVKNGLARIYGTRAPLPDDRDSRTYLAHLREPENKPKRFVVHADEKLSAFLELELVTRDCAGFS